MAAAHGIRRGNGLLWAGLAMMAAALVLAISASVFAGRGGYLSATTNIESLADAREVFEQAAASYGNADLEVGEVMEFSNNYYAEIGERGTDTLAMELLIDKRTGQVYPEPGPNMMWNTKYGMMAGGMGSMMGSSSQANPDSTPDEMAIDPERATEIANNYLERVSPSTETEEPDPFYGYYTLHAERDGKVTGMLSVNGYSGEVWYHSWHGAFIAMEEGEASH